ncbi:MAG: molybdopterin molybdotransferase MoeA, partial [Anaerolineae bacterium]|nr:molybdopterin molybdotransferase MoeA [Anaerolineae bacterium]
GASPSFALEAAQCALIHTGGMIPQHANAVVMVEHTQLAGDREIEVMRAAAIGENVLQVGEDVAAGETVIEAGTRFRPAHIGGLMALGITQVCVAERPQVAILSSGDEVIPPGKAIQPGQVRDVNTYSLSALVEKTGGRPRAYGIAPDEFEGMLAAAQTALAQCDMLVITAGSSASQRDLTAAVINALGEPGVMVHGINVRPGKPTILGVCAGKPVVGLPGNPVSALVIAGIFVTAALEALTGIAGTPMRVSKPARLSLNLASQSGREDWVPVRLVSVSGEYLAEPVFGKSNLIFSLARADGLIRIPPDANGLSAGEVVEVFLL